ncbi:LysR family transcriptional regulator [Lacrimispora xylanolytica]|uniref:LysR family transcriptional regulator n=1 Tax=Lacrimispora xylanolytica TaxID=29375 RepID=A0ABY7AEZ8_9FIRM|nr:LysR family transcriptional regulator [Lacrimispora xylanolytica]WAJ25297.1 LysR family transcriptional regulator [Lacrimispora xylanolytica]
MDVRLLKAFVTVASLHNFTKAAEQLGYAQSTITSQIQLLEKELGVRLFDRLGKKVSLTPEGEHFLTDARQLLFSWEKAKGSLSHSNSPHGILTIGVNESVCSVKLPKLLEEYRRQFPEVEFHIKIGSTDELELWLNENQIDVAVLLDKLWNVPELTVKICEEEILGFFVSPNHPLIDVKHILPHDVSDQPMLLVSHSSCWKNIFQAVMEEANESYRIMLKTASISDLKQFAILGFGVAVLPLYAVRQELESGKLSILDWKGKKLELYVQVVHHRDKWLSPSLEAFLDICKNVNW